MISFEEIVHKINNLENREIWVCLMGKGKARVAKGVSNFPKATTLEANMKKVIVLKFLEKAL